MNVLTIAGSDPSSGAGIQNDIKTFSSLGVYGLCVITIVTSQNTKKFSRVEKVSPDMIKSQLHSVLSDFKIDAIKIGMVYSSDIIKTVHSVLKKTEIPIILDPVFKSTTGGILLQENAFADFKRLLVPLCYIITPNVFEAEKLSGLKIKKEKDARLVASKIRSLGAKNIVITGGDSHGKTATDFVLEGSRLYSFSAKKIPIINRGSGCTFSAALAVFLAKGNGIRDSVRLAKEFTTESIRKSQKIGKGIAIVSVDTKDKIKKELDESVSNFTKIKNAYKLIPEVGTNFVFSKPRPRSINDIVGVSGRIVKAFEKVLVAGSLEYGGSRHVGSALLEVARRFPPARSAINVKYDRKLITTAKTRGFLVREYQRSDEPKKTKAEEGKTISWGIKGVVKQAKKAPDLIFHAGDLGKEPMIILFGKNPKEVLDKLGTILKNSS